MTILAKPAILRARDRGDITIEPFDIRHVSNTTVDVTLGEWYWEETPAYLSDQQFLVNPYDETHSARMWGKEAKRAEAISERPGIPDGTRVIILRPGMNILAPTEQFIGANDLKLTTKMFARSSLGRNQITVCRCAGAGDIGYADRWTMEITNNGNRPFMLVCGRRIAQIMFMESTGLEDSQDSYHVKGKYQTGSLRGLTHAELLARWKPENMLPKMWKDWEVNNP